MTKPPPQPSTGRPPARAPAGPAARPVSRAALFALLASLAAAGCSDDTCETVDTEIGVACLPDAASAGQPLSIEVREACGTNCATQPSCTALLISGTVQLNLTEDHCGLGTIQCESDLCKQRVVPCKLPALEPGDYPLIFRGGPAQVLHVRDGGAATCKLALPPPAP